MGTVDTTLHAFKCHECNATETVTVHEKGSMWGSSWNDPPESKFFDVTWERNGFREPQPVLVKCKACGATAK